MFSTFSKFSANNIDRINRSKSGGGGSDSELDDKIAKLTGHLGKIRVFSDLQRGLDDEQKKKQENKSPLSKALGGDTNTMIFGAMVFAFLVIATMGVAAMGAGPLGVAAMGVFAAGVGGALVAKAVKKFRNRGKSQGNYAPIMSQGMEGIGQLLRKQMGKDLGFNDQEVAKKSGTSFSDTLSSLVGGGKAEAPIQMSDEIKKQLTDDIKNQLSRDTIQEKEEALKTDINRLESKLYKNLEAVMGDGYTKQSGGSVILKADALIPRLLGEKGLKDGTDKEVTDLKSIMNGYDKKGLREQKLVLKTLNDIFDKCDDQAGTSSEKDQAAKKKTELANIIKGNAATDQPEKDKVTKLITDKKGEFDDNKASRIQKDAAHAAKKNAATQAI